MSNITSERTQQIHSPKFLYSPRESVYQRVKKTVNFSNLGFLPILSLTWDHMKVNVSNDFSSEGTHQIHFQKTCIHLWKVSTKAVKRIL